MAEEDELKIFPHLSHNIYLVGHNPARFPLRVLTKDIYLVIISVFCICLGLLAASCSLLTFSQLRIVGTKTNIKQC